VKFRLGFVSNSSSSSFILALPGEPQTEDELSEMAIGTGGTREMRQILFKALQCFDPTYDDLQTIFGYGIGAGSDLEIFKYLCGLSLKYIGYVRPDIPEGEEGDTIREALTNPRRYLEANPDLNFGDLDFTTLQIDDELGSIHYGRTSDYLCTYTNFPEDKFDFRAYFLHLGIPESAIHLGAIKDLPCWENNRLVKFLEDNKDSKLTMFTMTDHLDVEYKLLFETDYLVPRYNLPRQ